MFKELERRTKADRLTIAGSYSSAFDIAYEDLSNVLKHLSLQNEAMESLIAIRKIADESIKQNVGLDVTAANVLSVRVKHLYKRMGREAISKDMPSLESYGKVNDVFNTKLVIGNIDFSINDIIKAIKALLKKVYEFFIQLIDAVTNQSTYIKSRSTSLLKLTYKARVNPQANETIYNPLMQEAMLTETTIDSNCFNKYHTLHSNATKDVKEFTKTLAHFSYNILARELERLRGTSVISTIDAIAAMSKEIPSKLPEENSFFDGSVFNISPSIDPSVYKLNVVSTAYRDPRAKVKIVSLDKAGIVDILTTNIRFMNDNADIKNLTPVLNDARKQVEKFLEQGDVEPGTPEYETIYKASVAAGENYSVLVELIKELFRVNMGLGKLTNIFVEVSLNNITEQETFQ